MEVQPSAKTKAILPNPDLCDAYALRVPMQVTAPQAARLVFERTPAWVHGLMGLRNMLMKPFGLVTSEAQLRDKSSRLGMFPVLRSDDSTIVLGLDDKHLDFRIVLEVEPAPSTERASTLVSMGTNVKCHNALGKIYLAIIKPFHRRIAQAMLKQLAI